MCPPIQIREISERKNGEKLVDMSELAYGVVSALRCCCSSSLQKVSKGCEGKELVGR